MAVAGESRAHEFTSTGRDAPARIVRDWAWSVGISLPQRGRIPDRIRDMYLATGDQISPEDDPAPQLSAPVEARRESVEAFATATSEPGPGHEEHPAPSGQVQSPDGLESEGHERTFPKGDSGSDVVVVEIDGVRHEFDRGRPDSEVLRRVLVIVLDLFSL